MYIEVEIKRSTEEASVENRKQMIILCMHKQQLIFLLTIIITMHSSSIHQKRHNISVPHSEK